MPPDLEDEGAYVHLLPRYGESKPADGTPEPGDQICLWSPLIPGKSGDQEGSLYRLPRDSRQDVQETDVKIA